MAGRQAIGGTFLFPAYFNETVAGQRIAGIGYLNDTTSGVASGAATMSGVATFTAAAVASGVMTAAGVATFSAVGPGGNSSGAMTAMGVSTLLAAGPFVPATSRGPSGLVIGIGIGIPYNLTRPAPPLPPARAGAALMDGAAAFSAAASPGPFRQVATSTYTPNNLSAVNNSIMTKKQHYTRDTVSALQLVFPGWYVSATTAGAGQERLPVSNLPIQAWIEYPSGTYTAVQFSASANGTLVAGTNLVSDILTLAIPNNAQFWTWTYLGAGGGRVPYTSLTGVLTTGEGSSLATSGVPTVPSSTPPNATNGQIYGPIAILAQTSIKSVIIFGDSRVAGVQDTSGAPDRGNTARALGPTMAYANLGVSGDWAATLCGGQLRMALLPYFTHSVIESGVNDIWNASSPAANTLAVTNRLTARMNIAGLAAVRTTLEPISSSTDGWTTVANQTPASPTDGRLTTYNDSIRALGVPYLDLSTGVSSALDSGIWNVGAGAAAWTPDGIHENSAGAIAMATYGSAWPTTVQNATPAVPSFNSNFTPTGASYSTGVFAGTKCLSGGTGTACLGVQPGAPPFTMEGWIKAASIPAANACPFGSGDFAYFLVSPSTGRLQVFCLGVNAVYAANICDGAFHHIAVTQTLTGVTLFVDGVAVGTGSGVPTKQVSQTGFALRVYSSSGSPFAGSIQEIVLWNYVRYTTTFTPPTSPYVGTEAGLQFLWHLNGNLIGINGPAL